MLALDPTAAVAPATLWNGSPACSPWSQKCGVQLSSPQKPTASPQQAHSKTTASPQGYGCPSRFRLAFVGLSVQARVSDPPTFAHFGLDATHPLFAVCLEESVTRSSDAKEAVGQKVLVFHETVPVRRLSYAIDRQFFLKP
jgi:hypothetical protein